MVARSKAVDRGRSGHEQHLYALCAATAAARPVISLNLDRRHARPVRGRRPGRRAAAGARPDGQRAPAPRPSGGSPRHRRPAVIWPRPGVVARPPPWGEAGKIKFWRLSKNALLLVAAVWTIDAQPDVLNSEFEVRFESAQDAYNQGCVQGRAAPAALAQPGQLHKQLKRALEVAPPQHPWLGHTYFYLANCYEQTMDPCVIRAIIRR